MNDRIRSMEKIFAPRSVAFVGASNNFGKWGGIILANLVGGGYEGKIYPVNPKQKEIQGMKAYPSVLDIPGEVDMAIFTIPAASMPDAISQCVEKGVKGGVVVTAGFGEVDREGKGLEREMVKRARAGGMVLIGPNGQGISVPSMKMHPWMPPLKPDSGRIGIASQSGNVCTVLAGQLAEFGFGCSKAISAGNCADLAWPDYLDYFREDDETAVVLLYIEGVEDGRRFFEAARRTSLKKPVVAMKAGRTPEGSSSAASHTGALAGSDEVFSASCRQAGIIRVDTIEDATLAAATLVATPLPKGRRVGMITGGGGFGVIAADAASKLGLELVKFSDETVAKLRKHLPPWWAPNNPVDMVAGLGYGGPKEIVPILMESGELDGVILLGVGWFYAMVDTGGAKSTVDFGKIDNELLKSRLERELEYGEILADYARRWDKPLLMTSSVARLAIRRNYTSLANMLKQGIMLYPTIEETIRTYNLLAERNYFLEKAGAGHGARVESASPSEHPSPLP